MNQEKNIKKDRINEAINILIEEKIISKEESKKYLNDWSFNTKEIKETKINKKEEDIVLNVKNLTKKYPKRSLPAINDISFKIYKGEFHAFIGANGAGKTTTIKAIVTAYAKWQGEIFINGIPNYKKEAKKNIGYVPEKALFPKTFSTHQYLVSMAMLSGMNRKNAITFSEETLLKLNMQNLKNKKPHSFSSGQKKKILLAQALIGDPNILILDEPAANLDPVARIELFKLLEDLKLQGKSIFVSSHILAEIGKYADTATILDGGKIVYDGPITKSMDLEDLYTKYVKIGSIDIK